MTPELSLYDLSQVVSGSKELGKIMDRANEKYNNSAWKFYCDKLDPQPIDEWVKYVDTDETEVRASVLSLNSKRPVRGVSGAEKYFGNLLRMGHAFTLDAKDFYELRKLGYHGDGMIDAYINKYVNKSAAMIQGIHSEINNMVWQGLSTGKIVFDANNNPDGILMTKDLQIPAENKMCCKHASYTWWSDEYDPIQDLARLRDKAREKGKIVDHFEMRKETYQRLISHPLVLSRFTNYANLSAGVAVTMYATDQIWARIRETDNLPDILVIDELSMHEENGIAVSSPKAFKEKTVVLRSSAPSFDLVNTPSINLDDRNPATITTEIDNKFITIQKEFRSDPMAEITSFESINFTVPKDPTAIFILNAGKAASNGQGI